MAQKLEARKWPGSGIHGSIVVLEETMDRRLSRPVVPALLIVVHVTTAAFAATFKVNSTGDDHDASPGNGSCATAAGVCTLRAAIEEAGATAGDDTIRFRTDLEPVIALHNGQLAIAHGTGALTIKGPGRDKLAIDGAAASRVLSVAAGAVASISDLTIRNGSVVEGASRELGGGIDNRGTLTLEDVRVSGNVSDSQAGGIHNAGTGTLSATGILISDNKALGADGGGLWNEGAATLVEARIKDNTAGLGGGILNDGTLSLRFSTVAGNDAPEGAGGMENGGAASVRGSTISANTSADHAAGIDNRGSLILVNSTVSGNVGHDEVGGIENLGTLEIYSSTITNNSSDVAGGIYGAGSLKIANSVLAGNRGSGGATDPQADCAFTPAPDSAGYNIFGLHTGCVPGSLDTEVDGAAVSSFLGPLADNGGPTLTHALVSAVGGPAVNGGNPSGCTDRGGDLLRSDQRGRPRPASDGDRCDIGAYELQAAVDFADFSPVVRLDRTPPQGDPNLELDAVFRLGHDSDSIDLDEDAFTLNVGSYTLTLDPGSFTRSHSGRQFRFSGEVDGRTVRVRLTSLGADSYTLRVLVYDLDVSGFGHQVPVTLTIGDDSGSKTVHAHIKD